MGTNLVNAPPREEVTSESVASLLAQWGVTERPERLAHTLQVRVSEQTANRLNALAADARDAGLSGVTASGIARAAIDALLEGANDS